MLVRLLPRIHCHSTLLTARTSEHTYVSELGTTGILLRHVINWGCQVSSMEGVARGASRSDNSMLCAYGFKAESHTVVHCSQRRLPLPLSRRNAAQGRTVLLVMWIICVARSYFGQEKSMGIIILPGLMGKYEQPGFPLLIPFHKDCR